MEQKQFVGGPVYDQLPPLSAKYTWLVSQNLEVKEDGTEDQILYTIDDHINYRCRLPELLGRRIRGCFHGWVILSNNNNVSWSLWNPVTCNIIHLPPLNLIDKEDIESIGQCCLSSPPYDGGSVLLLTRTTKPTLVFCRLDGCKSNKKKLKWIEISYGKMLKKIIGFDCLLHCPTVFNGKVYALNTGNETDYATKTLGSVYLFKDIDFGSSKMQRRILWKEMVDLKDVVFFVDLGCCDNYVFYRHAIASELGGYIHILDDTRKMIYSYHVEDRTVSLSYMMSFQASHSTLRESSSFEAKCPSDYKQETNKDDKIMIRRSVVVTTDGVDESRLNDLPFHILEMITKLCVGVEYIHFLATCKHLRLAAPLIQWSNKAEMRRLKTYSALSPWLMVVDKNRGIVTYTDPILGDKYCMKRSQMMSIFDEKILCSRFGWLVYYKVNLSLMLFNPFTSEIHKLPSLNLPYLSNVCFSAPPSSVDCTVVGFSLADKSCLYLHIVAGEQTWQRLPLDYGGVGVDPRSMRFPTFVGRDLYALFNNVGEIYVLRNIVNGQQDYSWKKVVDDVGGRCGSQHFIVKSDQNLLLVSVSKFGEFVDVFKLNKYGKEWEKVDCLGRQMIYICSSTCVCVEAKIPEMESKIYFPRFGSKNGDIVFYSLETRKYHTFKDKLIRQNLGMGIEHLNAHVWIEPSWSNQCV